MLCKRTVSLMGNSDFDSVASHDGCPQLTTFPISESKVEQPLKPSGSPKKSVTFLEPVTEEHRLVPRGGYIFNAPGREEEDAGEDKHFDAPLSDITFSDPSIEATANPQPTDPDVVLRCVHELFEARALRQPEAIAIHAWNGSLTYCQLNNAASRLASYLVTDKGVKVGDPVIVLFEKSAWFYVCMLAVNKAGGAWVPLDPSHPLQRQKRIVSQTEADLVLTSPSNFATCTALVPNVVEVTEQLNEELIARGYDTKMPVTGITPQHAAYILFTSGTTGTPKGLIMQHSAVCTSQTAIAERLGITRRVRILQFASYVFDVCVGETIAPLITGATVCVPSDDMRMNGLCKFINDFKVNWAFLTPSFARTLKPIDVPGLELLLLTGEAVTRDVFESWIGWLRLLTGWGPAETCVFSTIHEWHTGGESPQCIGRPVACYCWIVDTEDPTRLAPVGCPGELVIQGPTILREYLQNPTATAQSTMNGLPSWAPRRNFAHWSRFYKSGDLCRYDRDGAIEFLGRKDTQVKIRGNRIELGEVEHQVRAALDDAHQVVVDIVTRESGPCLAAYICFSDDICNTSTVSESIFIPLDGWLKSDLVVAAAKLNAQLPSYMIPSLFLPCKYLPHNVSGKLDRGVLKRLAMSLDPQTMATYTLSNGLKRPPSTPVEILFQKLWGDLLKIPLDMIGRDDSFLRIGGDSISATRFVVAAREAGFTVTVKDIFDDPRLLAIANKAVEEHEPTSPTTNILSLSTDNKASHTEKHHQNNKGVIEGPNLAAELSTILTSLTPYCQSFRNCTDTLPKNATVFLTGATGYLGTEILRQLLNLETVGTVIALVRATSVQQGADRIRRTARIAQWWDKNKNHKKLEVWTGDLSIDNLGLDDPQWKRLHNQVSAIIHNGAVVNWNASFNALKAANVNSTVELIKVAAKSPANTKFVYVSGGVKTNNKDDVFETAAKLARGSGYVQTKFLSEAIIQKITSQIPAAQSCISTVKPGMIIGTPHEGVANTDDFLWRVVSTAAELHFYPKEPADHWIQVADVGTITGAIMGQLVSPIPIKSYIEISNSLLVTDFWDSVNSGLDVPCIPMEPEKWKSLALSKVEEAPETHPLLPVQHFLRYLGSPLLSSEPIPAPKDYLHLQNAVINNVKYLRDVGYIPSENETRSSRKEWLARSSFFQNELRLN